MGFFSKIWKGVKTTFKKIGRGIKKAFKSVGKFMGKIGILGTIGLTILTGGLGIGGMFTSLGTKLGALSQTMSGPLAAIMKGASWTIGKAAQFGSAVKSGFSTLTKGVTEFFGQTAKFVGDKLGFQVSNAPQNLGDVFSRTSEAVSKQFETFKGDVGDLFTKTSPTLEAGKAAYQKQVQDILDFDPASYDTDILDPQKLASGDIKSPSLLDARTAPLDPLNPTVGSQSTLPIDTIKAPSMAEYTESSFDITQPAMNLPKTPTTNLLSNTPAGTQQSFLQKVTDPQTYIQGAKDAIKDAPGAIVASVGTQLAMNAITGTPDYDTGPSFGSYAPQFVSQDYGAVAQGLTPMANDGYQDMVFAYDALGQQSGGYGNLYRQRLGAFT